MTRAASPLRDRLVFLVGARRSGTNWLQRVVAAHPEVAVVPSETYLFSNGIRQLRERFHHGVFSSPGTSLVHMDREEMLDTLRDLCDKVFGPYLRVAPGAQRLVERTPEHVTCLDLIGEIYPDAWVVHIVRDGRDVARSLLSQDWAKAPGSIEEAALEWKTAVEAAEAAAPALKRYRVVRYEEMLGDPLRHIEELYGWLDLTHDSGVVEGALIEAEVTFNADPNAPKVAAGKWQRSYNESELAGFMAVAGETLTRLGYATGTTPTGPGVRARTEAGPTPLPHARRRLGRLRGRGATPEGDRDRQASAKMVATQRRIDTVISAVVTRRMDLLAEMAHPSFWVRVVGTGVDWKGRGSAAWQRFAATIAADPALEGRQVAGDLHISVPTSTAVMTFAGSDGTVYQRIVAVTLQGDAVARLTYYQHVLDERR